MHNCKRFGIVIVTFLILAFATVCFAMGTAPQSNYRGGGSETGIFSILTSRFAIVLIILFLLPLIKAF
jgi:hypothetical protein